MASAKFRPTAPRDNDYADDYRGIQQALAAQQKTADELRQQLAKGTGTTSAAPTTSTATGSGISQADRNKWDKAATDAAAALVKLVKAGLGTIGRTSLSVAPASADNPIAAGINDPLLYVYQLLARFTSGTATAPSGTTMEDTAKTSPTSTTVSTVSTPALITPPFGGRIEFDCAGGSIVTSLKSPNHASIRDGIGVWFVRDDPPGTVYTGVTVTINAESGSKIGKADQVTLTDDQDSVFLIASKNQNNWIIGART